MSQKTPLMKNKKFLAAVSIIISLLFWLYISVAVSTSGETTIESVGVNINVQSGILGQMGLSVIEGGETTVKVVISGSRTVIGGVTAEDITIAPSLSGVSGAGKYDLKLVPTNVSGKNFDIVSVFPETVSVKFDKYVDKPIKIDYEIVGDYNIPDEYLQEQIYVEPAEVILTGPEKDIYDIDHALVKVEMSGDYTVTQKLQGDIILTDSDKNPISYNEKEVRLNVETAAVCVPIHEIKDLPVRFAFTNIPKGFDVSKLGYTLSTDSVRVEGENEIIRKYSDIFLGYIDFKEIDLENSSFDLNVDLPEGLTSIENTDFVKLDFNLEDYSEATFNVSTINVINVPEGYKATPNVKKLTVDIIGPESVLKELSANDLVVEVDLSSREIKQTGQYKVQADVILPGEQVAWARGTQLIAVTIKEQ